MLVVGLLVVMGAVLGGFIMAGGQVGVLIQISEFIVIGGAGLGAILVANPPSILGSIVKASMAALKGNPYKEPVYLELLRMLYDLFMLARREGVLWLEQHIEHPDKSDLFVKYPSFHGNHHALTFLADTMRLVIDNSVQPHELLELMEMDLERHHEEELKVSKVVATTGDAMPGFGIVAAVLGVVITMGAIGGDPAEIGHHVAAALVGTFIGILLSYGVFNPIAAAIQSNVEAEGQYLSCIMHAIHSFARGDAPVTAVEFARRNIEPGVRPNTLTLQEALNQKQAA